MSVLTKKEILKEIKNSGLIFNPNLDRYQLQPHAVDLRLGFHFCVPKTWKLEKEGRRAFNIDYLNDKERNSFDEMNLKEGQYFEILPREFVIASTLEKVEINNLNIMAVLYPRSSFNRRGLSVDLSGIVDTGYKGKLMIPIRNNTNQIVKIYPGERICQLVFQDLKSKLTQEEADIHGVEKAKNLGLEDSDILKNSYDKGEETKYISKGKIKELKEKYNI
ncbi:dCTP deaminase [Patescibacteria group bacterium]|nr:dCTP deaminase [Patescibacteria group bacterium]